MENTLQYHKQRIEEVHDGATIIMNSVNYKLKHLDETDKVKKWVNSQIEDNLYQLKSHLSFIVEEVQTDLQSFKESFNMPGIVGEGLKYKTISEYLNKSN